MENKNKRLLEIMKVLNLNQTELADKLDIKQPDISKMVNGKKSVGDSVCYSIICNLSINPKWLEYGEEPMTIDYEALKNESITKESQNESIKNKQETIDAQKVTINSLQKIVSTLEVRICELENQLQEARHALKNTVGAD